MNPQTVVPNLDVLPDVSMRPFARFVRLYMYELTVNDAVKCFNASVVVTVALATHAAFYLVLFPPCLVLIGRILAASIRRMQHAISWFFPLVRVVSCAHHEFLGHACVGFPSNHFSCV